MNAIVDVDSLRSHCELYQTLYFMCWSGELAVVEVWIVLFVFMVIRSNRRQMRIRTVPGVGKYGGARAAARTRLSWNTAVTRFPRSVQV